jgi:hypothetical protein
LALLALAAFPATAGAVVPDFLASSPEDLGMGSGAGRMLFPAGIAADPNLPGNVYVADRDNNRVDVFSPWGEFLFAFGWHVDAEAPEEKLQACTFATGCQKGSGGAGAGQLGGPEGVAVGPEGDVYVVEGEYLNLGTDIGNHRVQKFDSEGHFILSFGYKVNQSAAEEARTSEEDVCPAPGHPADVCRAGTKGAGPGQLGAGENQYRRNLAVSSTDGTVFLGEPALERIQAFDPDGSFKEEIVLPGEANTKWQIIAIDEAGTLYAGFEKKHTEPGQPAISEVEIRKLKPSGPSAEFLTPTFAPPASDLSGVEGGIAVDSAGNLYVAGGSPSRPDNTNPGPKVLEFDLAGTCLDCGAQGEGGEAGFGHGHPINALASGAACGSADIYALGVSSPDQQAFFNIWGSAPNTALCPPPVVPPRIDAQWAASVDAASAELHAEINPEFWTDTRYYLEYGTSPCFEGGCTSKPAAPGALLSHKAVRAPVKTAPVFLEGLEPGTTYHYRFVAQSSGGGPTVGLSGKSGAQGEGTFITFPETTAFPPCENDPFRIGPGASLLDCRAYEMVSPLDKEGGDIKGAPEFTTSLPATFDQSAVSGERLTYGTYRAFGEAESAPFTSQYIAARSEEGWQSHSISPPRGKPLTEDLDSEFTAFSSDLCEAWLADSSDLLLSEDAVPGQVNLYRRTDSECGGPNYEALTTVAPPHDSGGLEVQGASADGQVAIYALLDSLPVGPPSPPAQPEACEHLSNNCSVQLYYRRAGGVTRYVCVLPDAAAIERGRCTAGSGNNAGNPRFDSIRHALSASGNEVFWSWIKAGGSDGQIYMRRNAGELESVHLHGTAAGKGDLIGPATATAKLINSSLNATELKVTSGRFAVGQAVSGEGIAAGTMISECSPSCAAPTKLKLSKAATKSGTGIELTAAASATVANVSAESGAFAAGQEVSADNNGIAPGTTIVSCSPSCGSGATSLTLSAKATEGGTVVALAATSECTEVAKACTLAVSREAEAAVGSEASHFWGAAEDGSRAIFTTAKGSGAADLYEYDAVGGQDHMIAHQVGGVAGMSADAKWIYFASKAALAGEPNSEGDMPVAGEPNLYLFHEGEYRFIASGTSASSERPIENASHVSADGRHIAFLSKASPTRYDNLDAGSGKADAEAYVYHAEGDEGNGRLLCASCNPSGARPVGGAHLSPWENNLYDPRALADDGSRLFFDSADALVPRDSNGAIDVYEWEVLGTGSCTGEEAPGYSARDGGCVSLISSGQSPLASEFVDASPDGHDAFFATLSSLLPQDPGLIDIYDARVEGGFPQPPVGAAACEGEACQSPPEAPNDPTPASESFEGAGNVREEPVVRKPLACSKGKVRRHGKCVAKHKARKRAKRKRRATR